MGRGQTYFGAESPAEHAYPGKMPKFFVSWLQYLPSIYLQLRHLRPALSRVLHPMLTAQSSPVTFYSQFLQAATKTAKEIQDFTTMIEGDRSQEVLKKAKRRRSENPEGIRGWLVNEHPDWLEVKSEDETLDPVAGNAATSTMSEAI